MPRNGSGNYTAPTNSWNPAVNGVLATTADWQGVLNDIVAALSQSVSRDGQTSITGNLPLSGNKLTGLGVGNAVGDSLAWQQLFSQGSPITLASAATVDIGAQFSTNIVVGGNTTITSFGSNYNGPRFVTFTGSPVITHSASLILPDAVNISAKPGDAMILIPAGAPGTGWRCVSFLRATAILDGQGIPDFITSAINGGTPYSYLENALVRFSNQIYVSLVANNTTTPANTTNWALLPVPALVQRALNISCVAGGSVNAITGAFTPAILSLPTAPGTLFVTVRALGANTSTTPTFAANGTAAKTIVKNANQALKIGDIAGASHWLLLQYDATLDKWVLLNPAITENVDTVNQFNNSTAIANTQFVKRVGVERSAVHILSTTTTLNVSHAGSQVVFGGAGGYTITLPPASAYPDGASIDFFSAASGNVIVTRSGSDNITVNTSNLTAIGLGPGDTLTLIARNGAFWTAQGGSAQLSNSASFFASKVTNGYQILPGGMIMQWGMTASIAQGAAFSVTFPVAYSTICAFATVQPVQNGASANANQGVAKSLTGLSGTSMNTSSTEFNWFAVGY